MKKLEMLDGLEKHAEQINKMHGLDARHMFLIQSVRELVAYARRLRLALEPFNIPVAEEKLNEVHEVSCGGWHLRAIGDVLNN